MMSQCKHGAHNALSSSRTRAVKEIQYSLVPLKFCCLF